MAEIERTIFSEIIFNYLFELSDQGKLSIIDKHTDQVIVFLPEELDAVEGIISKLGRKWRIDEQKEKEEKKTKDSRVWVVKCIPCGTAVHLDIGEFRIISTDQGAEFIRKPAFVCGKCGSNCAVFLLTKEDMRQKEQRHYSESKMIVSKSITLELDNSEREDLSALLEFARIYINKNRANERAKWFENLGLSSGKEFNRLQTFLDSLFESL